MGFHFATLCNSLRHFSTLYDTWRHFLACVLSVMNSSCSIIKCHKAFFKARGTVALKLSLHDTLRQEPVSEEPLVQPLECPSLFVILPHSFWDFPDFFGDFSNFSRIFLIYPLPLSQPIKKKHLPNMTGRPGYRTMEMNGGSSAPYLARTPCVPLFSTLFNRGGNRRAFRLPRGGGDHFHCALEPSPGHIRCR